MSNGKYDDRIIGILDSSNILAKEIDPLSDLAAIESMILTTSTVEAASTLHLANEAARIADALEGILA